MFATIHFHSHFVIIAFFIIDISEIWNNALSKSKVPTIDLAGVLVHLVLTLPLYVVLILVEDT